MVFQRCRYPQPGSGQSVRTATPLCKCPDSSYEFPGAGGDEEEENGEAEAAVADLLSSADARPAGGLPECLINGAQIERFAVDQGSDHDRLVWYFDESSASAKGLVAAIRAAQTGEILVAVPGSFKPRPALPMSPTQRQPRGSVTALDAMGQSIGKTIPIALVILDDARAFSEGGVFW